MAKQRYEIRAAKDGQGIDSVEKTAIASTDDLAEAQKLRKDSHNSHRYGTAIVDTKDKTIDFGGTSKLSYA